MMGLNSVASSLLGFGIHHLTSLGELSGLCYMTLETKLPLSVALSDPVAKESCMLNLLLSLPEANLVTFLFLLDHLKR